MMGQNSNIEWTDNTANFWWGCLKVSPGCEHCYADTLANRYGKKIWGPSRTTARELKKAIWKNVLKWDADAREQGVRKRMFVMSMGDFLEDHPQVIEWRNEAVDLLAGLTNTDVQMLTKRPENARRFLPSAWFSGDWPKHIWLGTSVENQEQADKRIPELLKVPVAVRFLSVEPLLGPVDLGQWIGCRCPGDYYSNGGHSVYCPRGTEYWGQRLHWVIAGGESGPNARPMHPDWARALRDQCTTAGVAFHFKQWGIFLHTSQMLPGVHYTDGEKQPVGDHFVKCTSKHAAGRLLDGRTWDEFPNVP